MLRTHEFNLFGGNFIILASRLVPWCRLTIYRFNPQF